MPGKNSKILSTGLLKTQAFKKRQTLSEKLLQNLAADAKISQVKLKISQTRQFAKRRNNRVVFKLYGYYRARNNPPASRLKRQQWRAGYILSLIHI